MAWSAAAREAASQVKRSHSVHRMAGGRTHTSYFPETPAPKAAKAPKPPKVGKQTKPGPVAPTGPDPLRGMTHEEAHGLARALGHKIKNEQHLHEVVRSIPDALVHGTIHTRKIKHNPHANAKCKETKLQKMVRKMVKKARKAGTMAPIFHAATVNKWSKESRAAAGRAKKAKAGAGLYKKSKVAQTQKGKIRTPRRNRPVSMMRQIKRLMHTRVGIRKLKLRSLGKQYHIRGPWQKKNIKV